MDDVYSANRKMAKQNEQLRAENERLKDNLSACQETVSARLLPDEVVDIKVVLELRAENERLRDLLRQALYHVQTEGDDTLEAIIDETLKDGS